MLKNIKAIIFDMDGVIVDSEALHVEAELEICRIFGMNAPLSEWENFKGRPASYTFRYLIDNYGSKDMDVNEVIKAYYVIYLKIANESVEPIEGVLDFLEKCKSRFHKIGLTTSGRKASQEMVFDKLNLHGFFDAIITGDDIENGKPHPEPYLKTVDLLEFDADKCLVIEDSLNGILSAKGAGCAVAGITGSFARERLIGAGADLSFDKYSELGLYIK